MEKERFFTGRITTAFPRKVTQNMVKKPGRAFEETAGEMRTEQAETGQKVA
jgi:hypothetical protein